MLTKEEIAALGLTGLSKRLDEDTYQYWITLRSSGILNLQHLDKELAKATPEDLIWKNEDNKKSLYNPKTDRQLTRTNPNLGKDYLKDCIQREKEEREAYLKDNFITLNQKYPIYITEWLGSFHSFFSQDSSPNPNQLDWDIYFSILKPFPEVLPRVPFIPLLSRLNTLQKDKLRPSLIKFVWENLEWRNKVLTGQPLPKDWDIIIPHLTLYMTIKDKLEAQTHSKEPLSKVFEQMLKAKEEGKDIKLIPPK